MTVNGAAEVVVVLVGVVRWRRRRRWKWFTRASNMISFKKLWAHFCFKSKLKARKRDWKFQVEIFFSSKFQIEIIRGTGV